MQCPNRECGATVDEGASVCPQCGTDLKPSVPPGPSGGDNLGTEALAQASHRGRVRKLTNTSLILAILSCPLSWIPVTFALILLLRWALPSEGLPSQGEVTYRAFLAYVGTGIIVLFLSLSAIVTGHIAMAKGKRLPRTDRVLWRPLFGTLLGYLNVVLITLMALAAPNKGRLNQDMAVCGGNLKRVRLALQEYAKEHRGMFPPLSSQPGVLMFSPEAIAPKDGIGPLPLTCPTIRYAESGTAGHKAAQMETPPFDDQSYFYLGYAVLDDDDVEAFAKAYRKQIAEGGTFDEDLVVEDGEGTRVLHRLSEDVMEVWRATQDPHSVSPHEGRESGYQEPCTVTTDVPVLIERDLGHHVYTDWGPPRPRGAHVLYLHDGYLPNGVGFVERGTWPMTEKTQRILAELAE